MLNGNNIIGEARGSEYPLVSIGIPTHNSKGKIAKTLSSIQQQDYPNIEVIVSDNCSTDNTEEICTGFSHQLYPITYFRQTKNIGIAPNFEFVRRQASGDFFMWIADDDTLEPGILKKYVDFLVQNPDYSLVSGQILYWLNNQSLFREMNFSMEQNSRAARVIQYYFKVVYGAMIHGLMRRKMAGSIPLRSRIGDDWHFVATLAYLGKIKNLDCVGYHKEFGGLSRNFKLYAKVVGASRFSADFPRLKLALDAFSNILLYSSVYAGMPAYSRFALALSSCVSILIKYFCKEIPFIVGGKIKRMIWSSPQLSVANKRSSKK